MSFQIETKRLIIRDVREDDFAVLLELYAEPEARENVLAVQADEKFNRKDLEAAVAWAREVYRPHYKLSVELKDGGTLIGSCVLSNVVAGGVEAYIGWHYGHRFRGNGYATEVAYMMLDFAFEFVKVNVVYADCFAENRASIRIMEKVGMKESWNLGLFNIIRGWSYREDKPTVRRFMTREHWQARR